MRTAFRTCLFASALVLAAPTANAELYAYSDTAGATTYTDRPSIIARSSSGASNRAKGISIGVQYASRTTELSTETLAGTWRAVSQDGMHTRFEIRKNGTFVFDQRDTRSPERTWMCGSLDVDADSVTLALSESKHRSAEGAIEQQLGGSQATADVVSATDNQLVVRLGGDTLFFARMADPTR